MSWYRTAIRLLLVCFVMSGTNHTFAQEGDRQPAEGEGRLSPEADAPRRRSPDADRVRSAEGQRDRDQPALSLRGFKPATERETALFQMIQQLQREVANLRREIRGRGTSRDRDAAQSSNPATLDKFNLPDRWQRTKEGKVFQAYDKNEDGVVVLSEWLAMTNGNVSDARRKIQTERFNQAEPSGDGRFQPAEFIWWYSVGRHGNSSEGDARDREQVDHESPRRGPRNSESRKDGPRDGDSKHEGPRDGDVRKAQ